MIFECIFGVTNHYNQMTRYCYAIGKDRFGPYTVHELQIKKIARDTLVWHDELKDWVYAASIQELSVLFSPPVAASISIPVENKRKKLKAWFFIVLMVAALFTCMVFLLVKSKGLRNSRYEPAYPLFLYSSPVSSWISSCGSGFTGGVF